MQNPIIFYLNSTEFQFPCSMKLLKQIPSQYEELSDLLIGEHKYDVQSPVQNEIFQMFLDFWQNETLPEFNKYNIWDFYLLSNEFGIMTDYITSPQFEQLFNITYLIHSEQESSNNIQITHNFDRTFIERKIALNLQDYLVTSPDDLFQMPLNSLYNIFSHPESNLQDHEMAYKLILKSAENQNEDLYVLLSFLDGSKINSTEIRSESFIQRYNHFGFLPKNITPDDVLQQQNEQNQSLKGEIDELKVENEQLKEINEQLITENQKLHKENERLIKNHNQNLLIPQLPPEIKILGIIGDGSFGQVFLVENTISKAQYATKVSYKSLEIDMNAIASLLRFKHPSLLQITNIEHRQFLNKNHLMITTKYMPKGTLAQNFVFNDNTIKYILILGIALGIQYLHLFKIVHGNLKLANIFLDENSYPLISDFGLSKFYSISFDAGNSSVFAAPEISNELNFKTDVYSYAMIAYSIITGVIPTSKTVDLEIIKNSSIKELMLKCLSCDPSERPSFYEIVEKLTDDKIISFFKADTLKVIKYLEPFLSAQELAHRVYDKILKIYHPKLIHPKKKQYTKISMDENLHHNPFNIILAGTSYAGKTTLLNAYLQRNIPIFSAQFNIANTKIHTDHGDFNLQIFEKPSYSIFPDKLLINAKAIIFVINVNRIDDLDELQKIINDTKQYVHDDMPLYLATSHVDLGWSISKENIESFANKNSLRLFITSINDYDSIDSMFKSIINDYQSLIKQNANSYFHNYEISPKTDEKCIIQ